MKKGNVYLVFFVLLLLITGCSQEPKTEETVEFKQEDFLRDMASGINDRLEIGSAANESDYRKLVDAELNKIIKYDQGKFADDKFDGLAQAYIDALKAQSLAVDNFRKTDLFNALWEGGRITRSGLIVYLYENYDLNLTKEQADGYRPADVIYSTDPSDLFIGSDEPALSDNDIQILNVLEDSNNGNSNYLKYTFEVKNNSSYVLYGFGITGQLLDSNGNVINGQVSANFMGELQPGKTATATATVSKDKLQGAKTIQLLQISYDTNNDSFYTYFPISEETREKFNIVLS